MLGGDYAWVGFTLKIGLGCPQKDAGSGSIIIFQSYIHFSGAFFLLLVSGRVVATMFFFFVLNGLHALPPGMNVSHDPKSLGQNLCLSANLAPKKQAREEELTEIIQISKKVARVEKVEFDLTNQSYMLFLFEFCSIFFLGVWKGMFFISIFYSFTFFLVSRKDVMSNSERQPAGSVGLKLGVGPPHVLVKV